MNQLPVQVVVYNHFGGHKTSKAPITINHFPQSSTINMVESDISVKEFYKDVFGALCPEIENMLDSFNPQDTGHFNVFNISTLESICNNKTQMPYNRRTYYKISLINGKNRAEYADKVVDIDDYAVLFATPKVPYHYLPQGGEQHGHFCIFTADFMPKSKIGTSLDDLPIYKTGSDFIYLINAQQYEQFKQIYEKMHAEMKSDYAFKQDLLRTYVMELIHLGQKLKPIPAKENTNSNASSRISSLFIELLERQFSDTTIPATPLRTAKEYADVLGVHVNHLNKVMKEVTGKTTTEVIASRVTQEAKTLLRQSNRNVSEIAYTLGFEEVAHFSNFFKKQTHFSPLAYRDSSYLNSANNTLNFAN